VKLPSQVQCIHFDLDSVLYIPTEFLEATLALTVKVMIQTGLRATSTEALRQLKIIRKKDSNAENHFNLLCRHFNGHEDPIIIASSVEKYWDCKIGNMTPAPDTLLILNRLYQQCPLTIISNGRPVKQAGKIYRLGLWPYFTEYNSKLEFKRHFFYASADPYKYKPNPFLWMEAKKDIGFDFKKSVMVGDRFWQDILGAKKLGMITVKINQGFHEHETAESVYERKLQAGQLEGQFGKHLDRSTVLSMMQPDYTIATLGELPNVLDDIDKTLAARGKDGVAE